MYFAVINFNLLIESNISFSYLNDAAYGMVCDVFTVLFNHDDTQFPWSWSWKMPNCSGDHPPVNQGRSGATRPEGH